MDHKIIIKEFYLRIWQLWWPSLCAIGMGLIALYFDERRDRRGRNSNN